MTKKRTVKPKKMQVRRRSAVSGQFTKSKAKRTTVEEKVVAPIGAGWIYVVYDRPDQFDPRAMQYVHLFLAKAPRSRR